MKGLVEAFGITVIALHAKADRQNSSSAATIKSRGNTTPVPKFQTYITKLNNRFRELKAQDLWTPLAGPKVDSPEVKALKGQLKALSQKVSGTGRNNQEGGHSH